MRPDLILLRFLAAAGLPAALLSGCPSPPPQQTPSPPSGWTLAVHYRESMNGMPSHPQSGRRITGTWFADQTNAYGSVYGFDSTTNGAGEIYCVNCRVPALWGYYLKDGPCGHPTNVYQQTWTGSYAFTPWKENITCSYNTVASYYYDSGTDGYVATDPPQALQYYESSDNLPWVPQPGEDGTLSGSANQYIYPNGYVYSESGQFRLQYQGDGNLVLLDTWNSWAVLWATGTNDNNPGWVAMQGDGNFVVYNGNSQAVWSTGTNGENGAYMAILNNGTMMLFSVEGYPLWWTNSGS